jgi:antirestriction protein ArdC
VREMPSAPIIQHGGAQAFYSPLTDRITLPSPELFTSAEEFHATKFHELLHASGHRSRLNRDTLTEAAPFGSAGYSREELLAEMGAAFLCAEVASGRPRSLTRQRIFRAGR